MTNRGRFPGWLRALVGLWTISTGALAGSAPPQKLDAWQGCLLTSDRAVPVMLEHASTREQHRWGLMERDSLPENAGMLFFYQSERSATAGFWMYRTRIPLDIAWLDENGTILATDTMTPCDTEQARDCPSWAPGVPHRNVLEMNAGFFQKHHVETGDKLVADLNDNKACPVAD